MDCSFRAARCILHKVERQSTGGRQETGTSLNDGGVGYVVAGNEACACFAAWPTFGS